MKTNQAKQIFFIIVSDLASKIPKLENRKTLQKFTRFLEIIESEYESKIESLNVNKVNQIN